MTDGKAVRSVLDGMEVWGRENDARQTERARRMFNLEPETAALVGILARSARRTRALEVGTSNGYSTICLAWAVRDVDPRGRVVSVDRDPDKHAMADANLRHAGLRDAVELRRGDAAEVIAGLLGPFDLVFLDSDRVGYPALLAALRPKLTPDALVLADNVLSHPDEVAEYLRAVDADPGFLHTIVPVGKGLSLAYRLPAPEDQSP